MPSPQTVLIVDDNDGLRAILTAVLSSEGYSTREVADGAQAVDVLRGSRHPLVVLLDLKMPQMTGQDVLNLLDASVEMARHAYIVLTADRRLLDSEYAALLLRRHIPLLEKRYGLDTLLAEVSRAASRIQGQYSGAKG